MLIVSLLYACSTTVSVAGVLGRYIVIGFDEGWSKINVRYENRLAHYNRLDNSP